MEREYKGLMKVQRTKGKTKKNEEAKYSSGREVKEPKKKKEKRR